MLNESGATYLFIILFFNGKMKKKKTNNDTNTDAYSDFIFDILKLLGSLNVYNLCRSTLQTFNPTAGMAHNCAVMRRPVITHTYLRQVSRLQIMSSELDPTMRLQTQFNSD